MKPQTFIAYALAAAVMALPISEIVCHDGSASDSTHNQVEIAEDAITTVRGALPTAGVTVSTEIKTPPRLSGV